MARPHEIGSSASLETAPVASGRVTLAPDAAPSLLGAFLTDPWVSDLRSSFGSHECQSTVGFEDRPCEGFPQWYVQLKISEYSVANPEWEGKLCNPCLAGWREWANHEPGAIRVISIQPIVAGD